jgi:ADP-ribose pyrophosphatase YjhB (NUDIX family)
MSQELSAATPRVASGVIFTDDAGRVLLVKPTYKSGWDIPGGYVEPGESPRAAAEREVAEELSMQIVVGRLMVVDWAPHQDEGDKLLFVFDGGKLANSVPDQAAVQESEIADLRFASRADLADLLPERLHHRIVSALAAPADPYLEHGQSLMR